MNLTIVIVVLMTTLVRVYLSLEFASWSTKLRENGHFVLPGLLGILGFFYMWVSIGSILELTTLLLYSEVHTIIFPPTAILDASWILGGGILHRALDEALVNGILV